MVPEYRPPTREWFHDLERFLAETGARAEAQEREARRRRTRYFAGTAICWLAVSFVLLISTHIGPQAPGKPSQPSIPAEAEIQAPRAIIFVQAQTNVPPLLSEPDDLKQVIDQLGAIEVQGSLFTHTGESYKGQLWIRKIERGHTVYLEDAVLYDVDGPFRLRLPANSTIHLYAPAAGLDWNSGWGVPIRTPPCNQPGACTMRLEDLLASGGK